MIHLFSSLDGLLVYLNSLISMIFRGLDSIGLDKVKIFFLRLVSILLNNMEIIQDLYMDSLILFKMSQESFICL